MVMQDMMRTGTTACFRQNRVKLIHAKRQGQLEKQIYYMQYSNHVSVAYDSNNKMCEFISNGDPLLQIDPGKSSNSSLRQGCDWALESN